MIIITAFINYFDKKFVLAINKQNKKYIIINLSDINAIIPLPYMVMHCS